MSCVALPYLVDGALQSAIFYCETFLSINIMGFIYRSMFNTCTAPEIISS